MSDTENAGLGRNEPCHCGSGKKFKRCHGVSAAPKMTPPREMPAMPDMGAAPGGMPGFDPSKFDPQMMAQLSQAVQRLPRGQLQKLQSIMQRAMAGKDVTREAAELERSLPPNFQSMIQSMAPQMMAQMGGGAQGAMPGADIPVEAMPVEEAPAPVDMSVDEARRIIEEAMASGKLSRAEGEKLLAAQGGTSTETPVVTSAPSEEEEKKGGLSKLFGFGKKK